MYCWAYCKPGEGLGAGAKSWEAWPHVSAPMRCVLTAIYLETYSMSEVSTSFAADVTDGRW